MKIKEIMEKTDFEGEFETKKRVFTLLNGRLYCYYKGRFEETLRPVGMNEEVKGQISGRKA
ncbi:MAG: hypothetical protein ACOC56_00385 [Atribacterota bacterium]